jgi:thiamine transport system ATP-binding protein
VNTGTESTSGLAVAAISLRFHDARENVLDRVSLEVAPREIVAILGPSGSGKSSLLRIIAGLTPPTAGAILLNGHDITHVPAHRRNIGMVFQKGELFPHMNVAQNIGYSLRIKKVDRREIAKRVSELLVLVQLPDFENRSVNTLSGGEATRVALARALASSPSLLLLDEPLTGLDKDLHDSLVIELHETLKRAGVTTILVTHDPHEAEQIADRVVQLSEISSPHESQ